mmetsp:Transcript_16055/g.54721  ORF Transcript_16055/g.54721 Transcript_16055/m.54721 type:complete len:1036 (-) Transcript_16055:111-3218(-)
MGRGAVARSVLQRMRVALPGMGAAMEAAPTRAVAPVARAAAPFSAVAARRAVLPGGGSAVVLPAAAQAVRSISVEALKPLDTFERRHQGLPEAEEKEMLELVGYESLDALCDATVPDAIKRPPMDMGKYQEAFCENDWLTFFKDMVSKNVVNKSFIGQGYYGTHVPPVILRNILENPGWYTQYTPYQAEISQGRLESLLNYQTMICDLTGLPMANASLLDEGTAAAEAMTMCSGIARGKKPKFFVSENCHPQTIAVCKTRADGLGLQIVVGPEDSFEYGKDVCGVLLQYPGTDGGIKDYSAEIAKAHAAGAKVVMAADPLSLTMLKSPGEMGADICIGSAQRFGVPMGFGGPHAAFLATSDEYKRLMPGRIIGISIDAQGKPALRMAMQTREQHIRRDKATSNICTAQALLANMAAMYAVYHGPEGLKQIAERANGFAGILAAGANKLGLSAPTDGAFFDTVQVTIPGKAKAVAEAAAAGGDNIRVYDENKVGISFDETTQISDVDALFGFLAQGKKVDFTAESLAAEAVAPPSALKRTSKYLQHPAFNLYHTEHEMVRYLARLEAKDLSMVHSMISLGSCTMKLNATTEMIPITWPELANMHPFAPMSQTKGYFEMFKDLEDQLAEITGFDAVSLQPNSGATGEYTGLMAIREYHKSRGEGHRNICIIPVSAHGTNPASAAMCGMKIVVTGTDEKGNLNIDEIRAAAEKHKDNLAALMVTYPSTHGVYEEGIDEICNIIHTNGGQVYMDGANMNAQVGLTSPGHIGADVCHLNLHKTFCIPHGGGGPGMGPIGVKSQLAPFLPSHPEIACGGGDTAFGTVAAAPYGSAAILPISFSYIALMGSEGLKRASQKAILNANYMARRLDDHYQVLFRGKNGTCAHEFIIDLRPLKDSAGIEAEDVAKRLMDYGYHAPTMSWPVPGTLMIEPTESETKTELDRFCNAMIAIREEIGQVERGEYSKDDNPLKHAPHTADVVMADEWTRPYSRETGAFPATWVRQSKFWPTCSRVDNVFGDRHLITTNAPVAEVEQEAASA